MSPRARLKRGRLPGAGPEIPVLDVRAARPGPTVAVVANLHGDECNGVGVVHRLADTLPDTLRAGRVLLVPSLNPDGLREHSRLVPGGGADPNRVFPGDPAGGLVARHAARVWRELRRLDVALLVDLHTDTGGAIPYAIVDRAVRGPAPERLAARCEALARASGLTVLREYPPDRYLRFGLDRSLPGALVNEAGVPAVTLEVGPRRRVDPAWVEVGVVATLGVLSAAGVVDRPAPAHPTRRGGGPWRRENGPRTSRSGVLEPRVLPGEVVAPGTVLAEVRSLDGRVEETLRASRDGFVVALPERAHVPVGLSAATLAVRDDYAGWTASGD